MAYQQFPHTQYYLGSNDQEAIYRDQKQIENRRKQQVQCAIGEELSRLDKLEYGDDILNYMFEAEVDMLPDVASIDIQTEVQWYMRPYLLDFLVEAHAAFALTPETFFLTLNILDRYCSKRVVYRRHYQLVGCTALLIAAKYDELSKQVPHVKELANMCCGLYDEDMFIQMERHVMMTLDWHVGAPTTAAFLHAALDEMKHDPELEHMALYISEMAMYHREFVSKRPSDIARASLALAHMVLGKTSYLGQLHWSSCKDSGLIISLSHHVRKPSNILVQKYKQPHYSYVALILDSFLDRHDAISQTVISGAAPPTPGASPEHPSMQTPQKQKFHVNMELPPTPPITPGTDSFAGYAYDVNAHRAPEIPGCGITLLQPQNHSFAMVDAA